MSLFAHRHPTLLNASSIVWLFNLLLHMLGISASPLPGRDFYSLLSKAALNVVERCNPKNNCTLWMNPYTSLWVLQQKLLLPGLAKSAWVNVLLLPQKNQYVPIKERENYNWTSMLIHLILNGQGLKKRPSPFSWDCKDDLIIITQFTSPFSAFNVINKFLP